MNPFEPYSRMIRDVHPVRLVGRVHAVRGRLHWLSERAPAGHVLPKGGQLVNVSEHFARLAARGHFVVHVALKLCLVGALVKWHAK